MHLNSLRVLRPKVAWLALLLGGTISLVELRGLRAADRPNVVVLLADDLGWRDVGCYGGPVKTPAIDGLARRGVRFTQFYAGAAVCSPSRAAVLTGRHSIRAGVYSWIHDPDQNSHLLEREVTIAEILKSQGYSTAHFGKWHLGLPSGKRKKPTPAEHGFDYWFATGNNANPSHRNPVNFLRNGKRVGPVEGYACQLVVNDAIRWLEKGRPKDRPFFLNVWFHEPHDPIAAPESIVSAYGELDDPGAIYSGTIHNTDSAIARLLEKLATMSKPENTLVVYSSDNGSYRKDRVGHLRGTKGSNYEGGIRVPGIFSWPGRIEEGRIENEPAGLIDLLPTICGLLQVAKPEGVYLDGADLSQLLEGRKSAFVRKQSLFWLLPTAQPVVALRKGRYSLLGFRGYEFPRDKVEMRRIFAELEKALAKAGRSDLRGQKLRKEIFNQTLEDKAAERLRGRYVRLNMFHESWIPAIKAGRFSRYQLFDLMTDPSQTTDLSKQKPELLAELSKELLEITASVMADGPNWAD